jgi:Lauroyl/myristoyl acyltransferase
MKSTLILALLRFLALLPLSWQRRLGTLCGDIAFLANTRMAKTTHTNLAIAFPELSEEERRKLAHASLRQTFKAICEAGSTWLWPPERALASIERVIGFDLLKAGAESGKGVVLCSPHLGNWELFGLWLNTCGLGQTHQLFQPPSDPRIAEVIYKARSRTGANMVATDKQGVSMLLRALRAGEVVGILPDQVPPDESGEFAPFFNRPALTMTLVNRLAQKTGARILVGVVRRTEKGFEIEMIEPDGSIYSSDLVEALTGLNRTVETLVRKTPEQYAWEYKRYKRQPEGMSSPYRA